MIMKCSKGIHTEVPKRGKIHEDKEQNQNNKMTEDKVQPKHNTNNYLRLLEYPRSLNRPSS